MSDNSIHRSTYGCIYHVENRLMKLSVDEILGEIELRIEDTKDSLREAGGHVASQYAGYIDALLDIRDFIKEHHDEQI